MGRGGGGIDADENTMPSIRIIFNALLLASRAENPGLNPRAKGISMCCGKEKLQR